MGLTALKTQAEEELQSRLNLIGQASAIITRRGLNPDSENSLQVCTTVALAEHILAGRQYEVVSSQLGTAKQLQELFPDDAMARKLTPWLTGLYNQARTDAANASNDLDILRRLCQHKPDVFGSKCEHCGGTIK